MLLFVKTLTGRAISLNVESSDTIGNVKQKIQDNIGIAAERHLLLFGGESLQDDRTLADYNIQADAILLSIRREDELNEVCLISSLFLF